MTIERYRVPVEQLEGESRVTREHQVQAWGDGMGPPPVHAVGPVGDDADGAGDGD